MERVLSGSKVRLALSPWFPLLLRGQRLTRKGLRRPLVVAAPQDPSKEYLQELSLCSSSDNNNNNSSRIIIISSPRLYWNASLCNNLCMTYLAVLSAFFCSFPEEVRDPMVKVCRHTQQEILCLRPVLTTLNVGGPSSNP